jgi:ubiquinone/menaquinone biosynthesis C-methylase UbiE
MQRTPEPELMDDPAQAAAYAAADFSAAHDLFVERFQTAFPDFTGRVLDLGCGPCDVTRRFARAHPDCTILAVDGAQAMLDLAAPANASAGLAARITLQHVRLPCGELPGAPFDAIISNSLLHHLHDPAGLWGSLYRLARPGAALFVMDLMRPSSPQAAQALVARYAAEAPAILQCDFYNSLCAAFTADEVGTQLAAHGLGHCAVVMVSDRHLAVVGQLSS